jgi:hypothetical protein
MLWKLSASSSGCAAWLKKLSLNPSGSVNMWRPTSIHAALRRVAFAPARLYGRTSILLLCLAAILSAVAQGQEPASARRPKTVRSFPLTKFYDTPDPLPPGQPGELIRSAAFDQYDVPMEVSAVRILYHSRSASGADVAASGVVLFPDKKPPAGGWPVIAWAHDLTGVARTCAPSLTRNLQHGPFLSMYVHLGYAVVATDYTGLGANFRSAFADMASNASDVIYSVPAARRAVPQLGSRWIAMGTGEGALALFGVAEMEHEIQDANYLGSITLSRLADLQDVYESLSDLSYKSPLFLAYGIQTVYLQFSVNDILTAKALPLYSRVAQACNETEAGPELSASEMLKPKWKNNHFVQDYFARNRPGMKPAMAPLLVLSSETDPAITETAKIVARLCQHGNRVQFEKYPGYDPSRLIGDSVRDQISWIEARFANKPAPNDCPVH